MLEELFRCLCIYSFGGVVGDGRWLGKKIGVGWCTSCRRRRRRWLCLRRPSVTIPQQRAGPYYGRDTLCAIIVALGIVGGSSSD
eukprot:scaffold1009_cov188-Alexandrium_tamarense.AAC.9